MKFARHPRRDIIFSESDLSRAGNQINHGVRIPQGRRGVVFAGVIIGGVIGPIGSDLGAKIGLSRVDIGVRRV